MRLIVFGLALLFASPTFAQSMVEDNARDAACEWSFKDKKGFEKCHIIAMGTHGTGALVLMFTIDNMVVSLVEEDRKRTAEIGKGGFWDFEPYWKGTYKDKFSTNPESPVYVNTIRLSNGYTIKMVY